MQQIVIRTTQRPYGFAVHARRDGVHLVLKDILGAERYVLLPPAVATVLRDELNAALATTSAAEAAA